MKDLSINITLLCSICGSDQFDSLDKEYEDFTQAPDSARFKCSGCGKIYTKSELLDENKEIIKANIEDNQNEFIDEFEKELKKLFKNMGGK